MNSIEIAVVILTFIFGGALLGMSIGRKVPRHLTPETKAVVTAAMAVIGTMTALVIGLLISTANTSFSARNEALSRMSADVVRLDQLLRRYGPETDGVRTLLVRYTAMKIDELFDHVGGLPRGPRNRRARQFCTRSRIAFACYPRTTMIAAGWRLKPCRSLAI